MTTKDRTMFYFEKGERAIIEREASRRKQTVSQMIRTILVENIPAMKYYNDENGLLRSRK